MTVFVDDMYLYPVGQFGRMKMSHLFADTPEELLAMADKIGVQRKWLQYPGTLKEHFDISITKRTKAIEAGAVQVTYREAGAMHAFRLEYRRNPSSREELDKWNGQRRA